MGKLWVISVANREGGYSYEQQEDLEAIAPAVIQALHRRRKEQERERAEEALRASEERLRLLSDNLPDSVLYQYTHEADGSIRFLYCSAGIERLNGVSPLDVLRDPGTLHRQIPQTYFERLVEAEERSARELSDLDMETPMRLHDGRVRWMRLHSRPRRLPDGRTIWDGVQTDITERKRAEEALQESETKYRGLFETVQEIFYIDRLIYDEQGNVVDWIFEDLNPAGFELLGLKDIDEAKGKRGSEVLGREVASFYIPMIEKARRSSKAVTFQYHSPYVDREFLTSYVVRGNRLISAQMDVTELKQIEAALKKSKEQYQTLFNSINEGFAYYKAVYDKDGTLCDLLVLEINPAGARITGVEREAQIGKTWREVWARVEDYWFEVYNKVDQTGKSARYENYSNITGKWYNIQIDRIEKGKFAVTFKDITERKHAEEILKEEYNILEEKVKDRTAELEEAYNSLKENERRLSEAQKMAHLGNWDRNFATDEIYWSDEAYRIFGHSPQELGVTYNTFLSYVHPDDRDYVDNAVKKALDGKPYSIDFRIISADGIEHIVHSQGEVTFDEENIPVRMRGTVQDITEHKKAEEEIRNLANIVESSNDAIITESLDGIITSWNKGAERIYGYSAEEILGKPISVLEPSISVKETKKLVELVKQGKVIQQYETLRLRKDGTIINVSITLSPVFDMYGKLTAVSVIYRDITESKRAEEKLRESEEKYRNIVETANEGILIINDKAIVTYANKKITDILGYSLEEGIGRPIWDFISEESKALAKLNQERRRKGINGSYELKLMRKDGLPLWVLINAKSLFDKDGRFMGSLSMLTDVTKRKEAEGALANIEIARQKEIHHRIKNNLQVISSLLDLEAEKFNNKEHIQDSEVLEAFRESQDRVISIALIHEELHEEGARTTDTLNFPLYLQRLVENLFHTYRLGNANITLKKDLEENIFFDMDTAVPLGIIVNELVSNSLKHAFSGRDRGTIQIKLFSEEAGNKPNSKEELTKEELTKEERTKEELAKEELTKVGLTKMGFTGKSTGYTLIVSDDGTGIPEEIDFENPETLGLQLVNILVDQLDGKIELEREHGTEFIIRFSVEEKEN
jgi:PAS domain S-box-containing protein